MAKQCSVESCERPVWGHGLCASHIKRKPITPKRGGLITTKRDMFIQKTKIETMRNLFLEIWKERAHICENCKISLGKEVRSYMFDHLLEKSKYPEIAYEKENIMIVCLECHDNKTSGNISELIKSRIKIVRNRFGK